MTSPTASSGRQFPTRHRSCARWQRLVSRAAGAALAGALLPVALLPVGLGSAAAAEGDLVTVVGAASATLPPREAAAATFVVTPADDVAVTDLTARVVRIARGAVEIPLGADPPVVARMEPAIPAVVLEMDTDEMRDVGSYDVLVSIQSSTSTTPAPASQLLTFTVTRDAAALVLPSTLTATRTLGLDLPERLQFLPGIGASEDLPTLTAELSQTSRVVTLRARQTEAEQPIVKVTVPPEAFPAEPNDVIELPYTITGATPGTETRTVQLSSPQLAAPVPVTLTVETRRAPALLGLMLLLGMFLGVGIRRTLPAVSARVALARERMDLQNRIVDRLESAEDEVFQAAARASLGTLRGTRTSAKLRTRIDTVAREVGTAWTDLTGRVDRVRTEYVTLRNAVRVRPHLPKAFADRLAEVSTVLHHATQRLEALDATAATAHLDTARGSLGILRTDLETWSGDVESQITRLLDGVLAGRTAGSLRGYAAVLAEVRELLTVPTIPELAADVDARLEAANKAAGYTLPQLQRRALAAAAEAAETAEELTEADSGADTADILAAARALTDLTADRADRTDDLPTVLAALEDALWDLVRAYTRVLLEDLHGGDDVEALLRSGDVLGAARAAVTAAKDVTRPTAAPSGVGAAAADEPETPGALPGDTPASPPVELPAAGPWTALPERAALAAAAFGVSFLQVLLSTAVVLIAGYALFLPEWFGTFADLVKVFTWALAVDTSIAGIAIIQAQLGAQTPAAAAAAPGAPAAPAAPVSETGAG